MMKLSAQDARKVHGILKTAAACVRRVTAERDALLEKVAELVREKELAQMKQKLASKGLNPWGTPEATEQELSKIASEGRLPLFKQALEIAPNMAVAKFGELVEKSEAAGKDEKRSEYSRAQLDAFVING
jgi:hypothetical protein